MSTSRRNFLQKAGTVTASAVFASITQPAWAQNLEKALHDSKGLNADELATEEDFWYYIQQSFTQSSGIINLNNGGVSPAPKTPVLDRKSVV